MPDQKKFASYAAVTIGSLGLIASTIALKYCPSLPPLIAGGMIGSIIPLVVCAGIGILSLIDRSFLDKIYGNMYGQEKINEKAELFDSLSEHVVPFIASAVVCFGVGAGLAALGLESPLAIAVLAAVACKVIMSLFSAITERFFSPPTPPGDHSGPDSKTKCPSSPPPGMVRYDMRVDGANGHNPTDHQKERECEGEASTKQKRKCQTYATRKKPIDEKQGEKEYLALLEEHQSVKDLEDHFKRISNLTIETESRKQPDSSVGSGVEVDGAGTGRNPCPTN